MLGIDLHQTNTYLVKFCRVVLEERENTQKQGRREGWQGGQVAPGPQLERGPLKNVI